MFGYSDKTETCEKFDSGVIYLKDLDNDVRWSE